jgi:hypothetical protein
VQQTATGYPNNLEGVNIMKRLINTAVTAAAVAILSAPLASFAQTNAPLTRAQVRAELIQLEKAGYQPNADEATYPAQLQAAEARVNEQRNAQAQTTDYGASTGTRTQSGVSESKRIDPQGVFFGQ